MKHHRTQAFYLLILTGLVGVALAYAIAELFQLRNVAPVAPTIVEAGKTVAIPSRPIEQILMVLGGRLSIIAGGAWVIGFLGKLHSRHSQQAVSYQDRLAGMDVIRMILQHGSHDTSNATLRRMTDFYLTQEDNAFRDPPSRDPNLNDVRKLLTTITEPVGKAVESVAAGIGKAKG